MFKKSIISVLMIAILLTGLIGCTSSDKLEGEVVATVNGESILMKEALFYLRMTEMEFELQGGKDIWDTPFDGRSAEEVAKERALESVIKAKLLHQKAVEAGTTLPEENLKDVEEQTLNVIEAVGEDVVNDMGLTEDEINELVKDSMLGIYSLYQIEFVVDEDEVQVEVDEYVAEYLEKVKKAKVSMLTFPVVDETGNSLSEEQQAEAKAKADEAHGLAMSGEKTMEELVSMYNTNDTANTFTDGIEIAKGENKIYDEELFDLNDGDVVVITTNENYQVVFFETYIYPNEEDVNNATEKLKELIIEQKRQDSYVETYEEWKLDSKIDIKEEIWNNVKVQK
ncbi:SurA N-terminal domain-containing protein [Vallitalea okinawensis]|uniref:SurA N-terminal domain-containing protein n=1 Tax=Vallitalea okinawensis TaxID=2078660 RepID=UPI000CFA8D88|nr:SurA N-terminal domain-containing protein [Vallitalea okinawensis]